MFLFHQCRAQLVATEHQAQLSQLQHSYKAVLDENCRLRQECLSSGTEILWLQDTNRTLRTQIQSLKRRAEDTREDGQAGQMSTTVDMATQEPSDVPDLKEVPSPIATSRSLPQEALQIEGGACRPPLTGELNTSQSSHPCLNRTPSPPGRVRSCPHRYDNLSDSGVSDVSDSPPPRLRQGLHTRQLESLTSNVKCFDSDSQVEFYLGYLTSCALLEGMKMTPESCGSTRQEMPT
eukprot:superscaffoldBa00009389_g24061